MSRIKQEILEPLLEEYYYQLESWEVAEIYKQQEDAREEIEDQEHSGQRELE